MIAPLLALLLLCPAGPSTIAPSLTVDLDGDGTNEGVTAESARGFVRLQVRDAAGRQVADAKAPSPAGDVVALSLTSGPLGSAGALIEVAASTDAMDCRTFWRYRDGALGSLALRDAAGQTLPACAAPGGWSSRWEAASGGRSAAWVRERTETVAGGPFEVREAYAFAGFSLDFDAERSATRIGGVPIPAWYAATLYSRSALEILYSRFRLEAMRSEPTLAIEADRRRGVFALRFDGPHGALVAPVDSYAVSSEGATLGARAGDRTARARVRFAAGGTVPLTVTVEGLGPDWDRTYSPAGAWRGGAREVFMSAADELASQDLAGAWSNPRGEIRQFAVEGEPPYRLRSGDAVWTVNLDGAAAPFDALLLPAGQPAGRAWGIVLQGGNRIDRVPAVCSGAPPGPPCRAEGERETLRRVGARINAP